METSIRNGNNDQDSGCRKKEMDIRGIIILRREFKEKVSTKTKKNFKVYKIKNKKNKHYLPLVIVHYTFIFEIVILTF